jgi:NADH:ubiquinone oxidoreductase subunit
MNDVYWQLTGILWTGHVVLCISRWHVFAIHSLWSPGTVAMKLLLQFFTWWNGSTWGTRFYTWRYGDFVGEDALGNRYYQGGDGRRWVQYNGIAEASVIPSGWHGWMHYRTDIPPSQEEYTPREWQKPHLPNLTGTAMAYYPKGSLSNPQDRPRVDGDYEAWRP